MRQLTAREEEAMSQARTDLMDGCEYDSFTLTVMNATYRQAWKDCLDYQQAKLDAYAAYVNGQTTRQELEDIVPEANNGDTDLAKRLLSLSREYSQEPNKISLIKALRFLTGDTLRDAKAKIEQLFDFEEDSVKLR